MSWTAKATLPKGSTIRDARILIRKMEVKGTIEFAHEERKRALICAEVALHTMFYNSAVGSLQNHGYEVTVSGHVNDGNDPKPWQERDNITIRIEQLPPAMEG